MQNSSNMLNEFGPSFSGELLNLDSQMCINNDQKSRHLVDEIVIRETIKPVINDMLQNTPTIHGETVGTWRCWVLLMFLRMCCHDHMLWKHQVKDPKMDGLYPAYQRDPPRNLPLLPESCCPTKPGGDSNNPTVGTNPYPNGKKDNHRLKSAG